MQFETRIGEERIDVVLNEECTEAVVNGRRFSIQWSPGEQGRSLLRIGHKLYRIENAGIRGGEVTFTVNGRWQSAIVKDEQELLLEKLGFTSSKTLTGSLIEAPMPGKILDILVSRDEELEEGAPVAILEAMKMENVLKTPASGTVLNVMVTTGDTVEKNQPLIEIKPRG